MKLSNRYRGFTIIELMIVMAIILILSVVLIPKGGIAKDKAKQTGKIVDKKTLQGYIDYKWENILDNCNGDKFLASKVLLRDLANDVEIKNMISPTNKKIKGIYSKTLVDATSTDSYINIVDSKSKDVVMSKDRLYVKDGKVLEGTVVVMSNEERIEEYGRGLKRIMQEMYDTHVTGPGAYRALDRAFAKIYYSPEKYGNVQKNPVDPIHGEAKDVIELGDGEPSSNIGVLTFERYTSYIYLGVGGKYYRLFDALGPHYDNLEKALDIFKNYKK